MSEKPMAENALEQSAESGTIQFSIEKTKHIRLNTPSPAAPLVEPDEQEESLLKNQAVPMEFEDVFSDAQKEDDGTTAAEGVVAIEEVFKQKASMINEDFHNETGEKEEPENNGKLKKAAVVVGIICGAIILAAAAVALIILL